MKKIVLALLLISFFHPLSAAAQENVRFVNVQVELLPEYDDPGMLVIYRVALPPDLALPVDVALRIPAASTLHAVAIGPGDGSLYNAVYEQRTEGVWKIISITATMPQIQVEFYDPQMEKTDQHRSYEFSWRSDYAVENMRILVQQPVGASNLQVEPDLGSFFTGENGLNYYAMDVGAPGTADEITIHISYQKSGDSLTIESLQVEPSVPIGTQQQSQWDMMSLLPWLLGVLGVLLLFGGGFWYWQTGRERSLVPKRKGRGRRSSTGRQVATSTNEDLYCHQCGNRAAVGDRFCRSCGERLRVG